MAKPTKPTVSPFTGLKQLSDKTRAKLMTSPDAPGTTPPPALLEEPAETTPETLPPAKKRMGRPPGKKSNPCFEQTTLYLDKRVKRVVTEYLQGKDDAKDLSEYVTYLMFQDMFQRGEIGASINYGHLEDHDPNLDFRAFRRSKV